MTGFQTVPRVSTLALTSRLHVDLLLTASSSC